MRKVCELRVHGVGGTPPEGMLGETSANSLARVAGRGPDGFYARLRNPLVEGYSWGPLTSGRPRQVLWILLLPFTLLNVAGWTLPPFKRGQNERSWAAARVIVALLGLSLTVTYVFGTGALIVKRVFFRWELNGLIDGGATGIWWGAAAVALLGVLTFFIARNRQSRFEWINGPDAVTSRYDQGILPALKSREDFGSPDFWSRGKPANQLLIIHAVVAVGALALFTARALATTSDGGTELGTQVLYVYLGLTQAVLLIALVVAGIVAYRRVVYESVHGRLRELRPFALATLSVALTGGFFAGLTYVVENTLDLSGVVGGPEINLSLAFGVSALVLLVSVAGVVAWAWLRKGSVLRKTGHRPPLQKRVPPGEEPAGIKSLGRVAMYRSFSNLGRKLDVALLLASVTFVLVATPTLLILLFGGPNTAPESAAPMIETMTGEIRETSDQDPLDAYAQKEVLGLVELRALARTGSVFTIASTIGSWLVFQIGSRLLLYYRKGTKDLAMRRHVGMLWDIFSFFPRRFHPLAVRPYAERAVPELQARIIHHLNRGKAVIFSTHSQGTILGYAALRQMIDNSIKPPNTPEFHGRIAFVTYGSPLTQLHARFFPGYFDSADFKRLADSLCDKQTSSGVRAGWRNFYRLTDLVGKEVHIGAPDEAADYNQIVPDPCESPRASDLDDSQAWSGYPDPMRTPFAEMAVHSYYNNEQMMKDWLVELRAVLQ